MPVYVFLRQQSETVGVSSEWCLLEVVRGVCDPVGRLLFGALGRAVGGEQRLESL